MPDPLGAAPRPVFESRIVIREDGTVVVEHAGEGLESLPAILAGTVPGDEPPPTDVTGGAGGA